MSDGAGDVLAQPTRARLFACLADLGRPVGTDELAAELGLHPSGVRVHLERLQAAGLVSRQRRRQARGRPRDSWEVAADALPGPEPPDAYRRLARWLAASIPARPGRVREVERSGRDLGRHIPLAPTRPSEEALGRALTVLGFAPRRGPDAAGQITFTLGNCPYREAVRVNQPVVCALHRGLTEGLLDQLDPGAVLRRFVAKDPDEAGCIFDVEGLSRA